MVAGNDSKRSWPRAQWLLLALVVATLLAYLPSVDGDFVHDDHPTVESNPYLRDLGNVGRFFTGSNMFALEGSSHTRPVLLTTYALNFHFGSTASGFRAVNLAIHCLNVVLLFLLVRVVVARLRPKLDADMVALASAALFALHPSNTQAVVYVSSRSATLAFTFYVGALLAFVHWRAAVETNVRSRHLRLALFVGCQLLALLTKEHTVSLLGTVILLEVALFQARGDHIRWRHLAYAIAATAVPIAIFLLYRTWAIRPAPALPGGPPPGHATAVAGSYLVHLATQAKALLVYLRLFALPYGHALQHQVTTATMGDPRLLLGAALILAALIWGARSWWRGGAIATGLLVFLCCMAPESLVRLNMRVNEHRFYLASIGLVPVVAGLAIAAYGRLRAHHPALGRAAVVAGLVLLAGLAWRSRVYAGTWKDECSLWAHTIEISPDDTWSQNNHGNCLLMANDLDGAEVAYRKAVALDASNALPLYNLSIIMEQRGRWSEALDWLRRFDEVTNGMQHDHIEDRLQQLERLAGRP